MAALIIMNGSWTLVPLPISLLLSLTSMTQGNYGHVKTANSKAPLFMVAVGTVLIKHEIIDPKYHK